jgi:HNH endonuclease
MLAKLPEKIRNRILVDQSDCWLWQGAISSGYGQMKNPLGSTLVHRIVYELLIGPIPERLDIDHLCRRRHCCNPAHLEPVTRSINCKRIPVPRIRELYCGPSRRRMRRPFCEKGHQLSGENLYVSPRGARGCMTCRREVMRRRRIRCPEDWKRWETSRVNSRTRKKRRQETKPLEARNPFCKSEP